MWFIPAFCANRPSGSDGAHSWDIQGINWLQPYHYQNLPNNRPKRRRGRECGARMYRGNQSTDTHLPQGQQWRGQKQARLGQEASKNCFPPLKKLWLLHLCMNRERKEEVPWAGWEYQGCSMAGVGAWPRVMYCLFFFFFCLTTYCSRFHIVWKRWQNFLKLCIY